MVTPTLTSAPVELDRWRRDTPGCRERIHLNNAGAGLMPRPVLDALTNHLAREATIGGYEAADEAEPLVRETYALVAQLVGAPASRPCAPTISPRAASTRRASAAWHAIPAPGSSRSRGCRPIPGWCRMRVPSVRCAPSWACPTWSTPVRPWGKWRST